MAYAQTNYSQLQGKTVNGVHPRYSIHDIGCFITAFCNLEERFGKAIAPDQLDNELAAKNLYIDVDDGVYDDVGWSTICAYDPSIAISSTGSGAPSSNDSIVKFVYKSPNTGNFTTHFCLVADVNSGQIIDSWDGKVKSWDVYGGPQAFASYAHAIPQPVTPAPDPVAEIQTKLDAANAALATQTAEVARLKGVDADNADLKKSLDAQTTRVAELGKVVTNLNNQITTLKAQLNASGEYEHITVKQAIQALVNAFKAYIK